MIQKISVVFGRLLARTLDTICCLFGVCQQRMHCRLL